MDDLAGDGGADAAPADEQPRIDELRDGAAHGGPGEVEPVGHGELVLEGVPGLEHPLVDRRHQLLRELVVQRDGAGPIDDYRNLQEHSQEVITCWQYPLW